jgi:hypothetical protein
MDDLDILWLSMGIGLFGSILGNFIYNKAVKYKIENKIGILALITFLIIFLILLEHYLFS